MRSLTCSRCCHEWFACICHYGPSSALLNGWAHHLRLTDEDREGRYLSPGASICRPSTETMCDSGNNAGLDGTSLPWLMYSSHPCFGEAFVPDASTKYIFAFYSPRQFLLLEWEIPASPLMQNWKECLALSERRNGLLLPGSGFHSPPRPRESAPGSLPSVL